MKKISISKSFISIGVFVALVLCLLLIAPFFVQLPFSKQTVVQAAPVADSIADFSGTQGGNSWSYAFTNGGGYTGPSLNMMGQFTSNIWYVSSGSYYTQISASTMHPNKGSWEQWPVRRWTSTVNGQVTIAGQLADANASGSPADGIIGYIFVNGTQAYSRTINEGDTTGVNYSITTNVTVGSTVDFAVSPRANDYTDTTRFTAVISVPTPTNTPTPTPTTTPAPLQQTSTPGIVFVGNGSADFGQGQASQTNWVVGGGSYSEVFQRPSGPARTSYQYILDKATSAHVTITSLASFSTCLSLANCTLPDNLASGVYRASGNLTLNAKTLPPDRNYIFLINGDLTIRGNIIVPNGSTAFFTANRDIIVTSNVSAASNTYPLPTGQIQGLFSANRNFTVQGINNCVTGKDLMLNVEGAIVTNAGGSGGTLTTNRDLCGDNPNIPAFTLRSRLDFLLNAPSFLLQQTTVFREDAP